MTSETRYFRNTDQHTINGLEAYKLLTSQSSTEAFLILHDTSQKTAYWGIRVWIRDSEGNEVELTGGTPVAQVSRSGNGEGYQSNTWNCPETALEDTDAVVVRVYAKLGTGSWQERTFITEQVQDWDSPAQLDAATWTIYYYTYYSWDSKLDDLYATFYYGTASKNSRIGNFSWSEAAPPAEGGLLVQIM